MLSVFLSYARGDALVVEQLARDLRGLGCTPWFDSELVGGADWWTKILAKIRETNVFIFATSIASIDSAACLAELSYARALNRRTVPVLVGEGVNASAMPRELAILQQVDYRQQDKNALLALARCLMHLDPEQPLPNPMPDEPRVPLSYLVELREEVDARSLDFDKQSALLVRINDLLRTGKGNEVHEIAVRFRRRRDLFAIVAADLDELIAKAQSGRSNRGAMNAASQAGRVHSTEESAVQTAPILPSQLKGKTYKTLRADFSDEQIVATLGIRFDGRKYLHQSNSFFFLPDAVNSALKSVTP